MKLQSIRTFVIAFLIGVAPAALAGCQRAQATPTKNVGDRLEAFIIKNCSSGERYCQVCAYSGKPKLVLFQDLASPNLEQSLKKLQQLAATSKDKGLATFALIGDFSSGELGPPKDEAKAAQQLKALSETLALTYPVTIVPRELSDSEKKSYRTFSDAYDVPTPGTIFLSDAKNRIVVKDVLRFDESATAQLSKLEAEIPKVL